MPQSPLEYLFGLEQFGIKFGLDNIRTLLAAVGRPDRDYQVAHIAGTNGKGSVSAMVDAALRAAGHHAGRYTSPHLVDLAERFAVDGAPAPERQVEETASRLRDVIAALIARGELRAEPTFFEVTTAMALLLFRDAGVTVAVCEVGLGGRLDATNVLSPVVTAITSIGFDHMQCLGTTLREIAAEKAGIIKPGVPVVLGQLPPEALETVLQIAGREGAPVYLAHEDTVADDLGPTGSVGHRIRLRSRRRDYGTVALALRGAHQIGNALVAVQILEALDAHGVAVPVDAVRDGLERVVWPGRLDVRRLADGRTLVMDAAHNAEGAQALAAYLSSEGHERPAVVFGAMKDKDASAMIRALAPCAGALVFTRAATPRSADPADLAVLARGIGVSCPVMVEAVVTDALDTAWQLTPLIVVAGSIFLLGDVIGQLGLS